MRRKATIVLLVPKFFLSLCFLLIVFSFPARAASPAVAPAKVSENGRYLVHSDGSPFFYLGDTAWELFHRLNREEADRYLQDRSEKGFTVIQAVVVGELNGLKGPNANGDTPFTDLDIARPNEAYFQQVDWVVDKAASLGLCIGMLPTWGRWVGGNDEGRELNDFFNATNARAYGKFLGARYKDKPIIWVLGGDRTAERSAEVWNEMAVGLREAVGKTQLITYHPRTSAPAEFHGAEWLDFDMVQSGHSPESTNYDVIESVYKLEPTKPCMDAEPAYEYPPDAMPAKRPVGAVQIRRNAYWAMFAGAHGHTYGTHPIWQMYDTSRKPLWDVKTPWHQSLDLPGARQLKHLKHLMLSRPFIERIPDQSLIVSENPGGTAQLQATRDGASGGGGATYLMVYFPAHHKVTLNTAAIEGDMLGGWWLNPGDGSAISIAEMKNEKEMQFEPPTSVPGEDWVLVLDDAAKNYPAPGETATAQQ